jgi:hypothetical protein
VILKGSNGLNWRLKDYEARGGYEGAEEDPRESRSREHHQ